MKPDRSNYEIWLIDWLDGTLDKAQVEQLISFLDENPDLKEEADSLSISHLFPLNDQPAGINIQGKTPSDLPHSQVEYLSVGYLENDLSGEQIAELEENLAANPENRSLFEAIRKIKLVPQQHIYRNKKALIKLTPAEKVIRLSIIGLSAAATIAVLIISTVFIPDQISEKISADAQLIIADTGSIEPFVVRSKIIKSIPEINNHKKPENEAPVPVLSKNITDGITDQTVAMAVPDTDIILLDYSGIGIPMTSVSLKPEIYIDPLQLTLIASVNNFTAPLPDDDRNRFSKFITKTFREKLLKEKDSGDAPIHAYELAEAGVEGLNKLMGWEMSLITTNDDSGDLKSVYFSSRILKFNAPVKKVDTAQ